MSNLNQVYLAGEIHTHWRDELVKECENLGLAFDFVTPEINHERSDNCGSVILGKEDNAFWRDRKSSGINSIRTRMGIRNADVVVARFGEKYRQWNAAFEAGMAIADGTPVITLHDDTLDHAMKEIDQAAAAVARTPKQVAEILAYVAGR